MQGGKPAIKAPTADYFRTGATNDVREVGWGRPKGYKRFFNKKPFRPSVGWGWAEGRGGKRGGVGTRGGAGVGVGEGRGVGRGTKPHRHDRKAVSFSGWVGRWDRHWKIRHTPPLWGGVP